MKTARAPRSRLRRILRFLGIVVGVLLIIVVGIFLWARSQVLGSLPELDGTLTLAGLEQSVQIERDAAGVPTIRATTRVDAMRALGFVHGQDRFFQMDLQRRQAAGELAEIFGAAALPADRRARFHRFRARSRERLAEMSQEHRQIMQAYSDGLNAGLQQLGNVPPEYLLLRQDPRPWQPEDSLLTLFAMYFNLQGARGDLELQRHLLRSELPLPLSEFLLPAGTEWDAALDDSSMPELEIPPATVFDLRQEGHVHRQRTPDEREFPVAYGSNAFAISGEISADGHAWLAGDMHLNHSMPNIWYRAVLIYDTPQKQQRRLAGVTLPGVPGLIAGSNGQVAWAFTNSQGDWLDIVQLEFAVDDPLRYRVGDHFEAIEIFEEIIEVKKGDAETLTIHETRWGPVLRQDDSGLGQAVSWVAHKPGAANLQILELGEAEDLDQALQLAAGCGLPAQNFNGVDAKGRVGWTIAGPIPRRSGGLDGQTPSFWSPDGPRWDGLLDPEEYPRLADPVGGRIWTANNRMIGGTALKTIGDGNLALGARAARIRDGLLAQETLGPADLLAIQLDDQATFLERWRTLLLELLDDSAVADQPQREEFLRLIRDDWSGRASIDSVGYRLVRAYRLFLVDRVFDPIVASSVAVDPDFSLTRISQWEGPLWALVTEQPPHLLNPEFESWNEALLAAVDVAIEGLLKNEDDTLESKSWGARNRVRIQHPLSGAIPQLAKWLDMPAESLPGDSHMPRVQSIRFGASQRFVVSPGREEEGYFHMPGGQSGHPFSPFYRVGHTDWARGNPSPFLPGPTRYTLELVPVDESQ